MNDSMDDAMEDDHDDGDDHDDNDDDDNDHDDDHYDGDDDDNMNASWMLGMRRYGDMHYRRTSVQCGLWGSCGLIAIRR